MVVYRPHPHYFRQAVTSILQQTFSDWELIIVEDPSPVSGQELLADLSDPRIRYICNPRRTSLIAQRNRALAEARADLVAIHDADDVSVPQRLARQVAYLQSHPEIGVVGSQVAVIDEQGQVRGYRRFPLQPTDIWQALPRFLPLAQPSILCRKRLLLEAGGYCAPHPALVGAEDCDLISRLAQRGVQLANVPEVLLYYRLHQGQLKATHLRDIIYGTVLVKRRYWYSQMDWLGRLRLAGEWLLLSIPSVFLRPLVIWWSYRDAPPPAPPNLAPTPALLKRAGDKREPQ